MKDEELNELKENKLISTEKDVTLYERLFSILSKKDKDLDLSSGFQLNLNKILAKRKKEERYEKIVIYSVVWLLIFTTIITLAIVGVFEKVNVSGGIQWYILISLTMIWGFRKIEKKFLKSS